MLYIYVYIWRRSYINIQKYKYEYIYIYMRRKITHLKTCFYLMCRNARVIECTTRIHSQFWMVRWITLVFNIGSALFPNIGNRNYHCWAAYQHFSVYCPIKFNVTAIRSKKTTCPSWNSVRNIDDRVTKIANMNILEHRSYTYI